MECHDLAGMRKLSTPGSCCLPNVHTHPLVGVFCNRSNVFEGAGAARELIGGGHHRRRQPKHHCVVAVEQVVYTSWMVHRLAGGGAVKEKRKADGSRMVYGSRGVGGSPEFFSFLASTKNTHTHWCVGLRLLEQRERAIDGRK
ncbi:hypothetical protein R6Q59_001587 [Mikania micrantha]